MNNSTREAKWQPLEHENRPGWPAAPSRHWQTSSGALYYAMGEVPRYRGAVFNKRVVDLIGDGRAVPILRFRGRAVSPGRHQLDRSAIG